MEYSTYYDIFKVSPIPQVVSFSNLYMIRSNPYLVEEIKTLLMTSLISPHVEVCYLIRHLLFFRQLGLRTRQLSIICFKLHEITTATNWNNTK